ncbi:putative RNA-directed DNA polymerase [Tanacetum coccineum]
MYGTKCTVFTDQKGLQHILDQKELNMRQHRWLELISDYDCEIHYHPGKANVVANALSRKERIKPLRKTLSRAEDVGWYHLAKWVIRFGKREKLNPRVHSTFHVSNLKKCLSDEPLAIPLDEIHIDDKLHFVEEPVDIMDHKVKRLKKICIPIVKVRWNFRRGPEFTWEREDQFWKKGRSHILLIYNVTLSAPYSAVTLFEGVTQGLDYSEVFAPVAKWDTIRSIFALAAQRGMKVHQLDVKSAFLYGELEETIFVEQPQGYVVQGNEGKVYRLRKALYVLKQAPRAWYGRIESYFLKEGFEKCPYEPTLFIKSSKENMFLIVSIYVDDLIITGSTLDLIEQIEVSMKSEFKISDMGEMHFFFLGVEVIQSEDGIHLNQRKYSREILERFNMEDFVRIT